MNTLDNIDYKIRKNNSRLLKLIAEGNLSETEKAKLWEQIRRPKRK